MAVANVETEIEDIECYLHIYRAYKSRCGAFVRITPEDLIDSAPPFDDYWAEAVEEWVEKKAEELNQLIVRVNRLRGLE